MGKLQSQRSMEAVRDTLLDEARRRGMNISSIMEHMTITAEEVASDASSGESRGESAQDTDGLTEAEGKARLRRRGLVAYMVRPEHGGTDQERVRRTGAGRLSLVVLV